MLLIPCALTAINDGAVRVSQFVVRLTEENGIWTNI